MVEEVLKIKVFLSVLQFLMCLLYFLTNKLIYMVPKY